MRNQQELKSPNIVSVASSHDDINVYRRACVGNLETQEADRACTDRPRKSLCASEKLSASITSSFISASTLR